MGVSFAGYLQTNRQNGGSTEVWGLIIGPISGLIVFLCSRLDPVGYLGLEVGF